MRLSRWVRWLGLSLLVLAVLAGLALAVLASLDLSPYRALLEARLSEALGRGVRIGGAVRVRLTPHPELVARDVSVAAPAWGDRPLAQAERLSVRLDLAALLRARVRIARVQLEGAELVLQVDARHRTNWISLPPAPPSRPRPSDGPPPAAVPAPAPSSAPTHLPTLVVLDSRVTYHDARSDVTTRLGITKAELSAPVGQPLQAVFVGSLRGRPLSAGVQGGTLESLRSGAAAWPLRIAVTSAEGLRLSARGELRRAAEPEFDLQVHASGTEFGELEQFTGLRLPPLGPFVLDARVDGKGADVRVSGLSGILGEEGDEYRVTVERGEARAGVDSESQLRVEGTFRGLPFRLHVQGGAYPLLLREGSRWPMQVSLALARSDLSAQGTLNLADTHLDVQVQAEGPDVTALEALLGRDLPALGRFRFSGRLGRVPGLLSLGGFQLRVGESDARGDLRLRLLGPRPALSGTVRADALHVDELGALLRALAGKAALPTVETGWADRPLPLALLRELNAELELRVGAVLGTGRRIEAVQGRVTVRDGVLRAPSVRLRLAGEALTGSVTLEPGGAVPVARLELEGQDVRYGPVLAALGLGSRLSGKAERLAFSLRGEGFTLRQVWAGAALRLVARRGSLAIARGTPPGTTEPVRLFIAQGEASSGGGAGLSLRAEGRYGERPFSVHLAGDGIPALADDERPWNVRAVGRYAGAALSMEGRLRAVFSGRGVDVRFTAEGERMAALEPLLRMGLPDLGPYHIAARLTDSSAGLRLGELVATVGRSDFAGELRFPRVGGRVRTEAELSSRVLRLADLRVRPEVEEGLRGAEANLLPALPFPLESLRSGDFSLSYRAARVHAGEELLDQVVLDARLRDGDLEIPGFGATFWGGRVEGSGRLEARRAPPRLELKLDGRDVDFTQALGGTGVRQGAGRFALHLRGTGTSLRDALGSASGVIEFSAGAGRFDNQYLDLWAADLLLALLPRFGEQKSAHLRCALAHFDVVGGTASTRSLLLDVERIVVKGNGTVELGSERLDLLLWPEPRDRSLISLTTPVRLRGTLAAPSISPQPRGVVEDVAWLLIGVSNPFVLLFNAIRPSTVQDDLCASALAAVQTTGQPQEHSPPTPLSKTGDFFRSLGRLLSRPFESAPGDN